MIHRLLLKAENATIGRILSCLFILFFLFCLHGHAQSVSLSSYLPQGYVNDGTRDYTVYLQKGLDENRTVILPDFPVLINAHGLHVNNNQNITFLENSRLIMEPNSQERYGLLNIINVENIIIHNPVLIGDREKHIGKKGEWGMGIRILSSRNVIINNPKVSKFWGDGIYIGEIEHNERKEYNLKSYYSENIKIIGGLIDNNRRNGISVISVKKLLMKNITIQNTEGTLPMAGIDIEPNNNEQFLEDILLQNITTRNNAEIGIKYVPTNFFGHRNKNVNIRIENSQDIGSKIGLEIGGILYLREKKLKEIQVFNGGIIIDTFKSIGNVQPIKAGSIQKYNPMIRIKSFAVYDNKNRKINAKKAISSIVRSNRIKIE